jgi:phage tail sheath protein FI
VDPLDPANIADPNRREPDVVEDYDNLGVLPAQPDFFIARLTALSRLAEMDWSDQTAPPARPDDTGGFVQLDTAAGDDGTQALTAAVFQGNAAAPPDQRTGLVALADVDTISILGAPDEVNALAVPNAAERNALTNALINQCETLRDRFAVLSLPAGIGDVADPAFTNTRDTSYAAVYYPWIRVLDPLTSVTHLIPPSGHVAGVYARIDVERGVHKAPANETVRGIVNRDLNATRRPLEFDFGKRGQDVLNPLGINVIRDFRTDRRDIRVWGARTLSTDPLWRYVNVRRLMLFIEESIDEGTQWVVFEPNDEPLWARVRQSVRNFLLLVWRTGALQGLREQDAFFVRCDRSTMTQADIDAGRLICLVGVAPVKPAEFVIFRISQITATESR